MDALPLPNLGFSLSSVAPQGPSGIIQWHDDVQPTNSDFCPIQRGPLKKEIIKWVYG
jgi:hypothetical protein